MKATNAMIPRRTAIGIGIFLLALLAVGSVIDYPLSCALYNEANPFAMFFAAYGEYPATLGWAAAGAMLLAAHDKRHRLAGALQCAGGVLLLLIGGLMACMMPNLYLPWPPVVIVAIGLAATAGVLCAVMRLCRGADDATVRRVALVIFLTIFAEMLLVNIVKIPWGRARMRLVATDPRAYFMPWWQPGSELKSALVAVGVAAEEFKSFPSGHTANATAMMLLAVLPYIAPKLAGRQKQLFWFGFLWTCVVAFTRIIMGAHYLTDVTVGFACGFAVLLLASRLLPKPHAEPSRMIPEP